MFLLVACNSSCEFFQSFLRIVFSFEWTFDKRQCLFHGFTPITVSMGTVSYTIFVLDILSRIENVIHRFLHIVFLHHHRSLCNTVLFEMWNLVYPWKSVADIGFYNSLSACLFLSGRFLRSCFPIEDSNRLVTKRCIVHLYLERDLILLIPRMFQDVAMLYLMPRNLP